MNLSAEGRLRRAINVAFASGAIGMAAIPFGTFAADSDSVTQLQGVQVTGSLLRRVDTETANPVQVLDRKAIEASGATTFGELLQQLPMLTGDALTPQVNNGGDGSGASTISLRGLGSARTLTLLDGKRIVDNDVNQLPINMIERVEVLNQGASTVYGSDAVAGVVNFITRKNFKGTEITGGFGEATDHGDAQKTNVSFTHGISTSDSRLVFGLSYDKVGSIKGIDRSVSNDVYGVYYNHVYTAATGLGSSRIPTGLFSLGGPTAYAGVASDGKTYDFVDANNLGCNQITRIPGATGATLDQSNYECRGSLAEPAYNYQAENLVYTPADRIHMFTLGQVDLNENVRGYVSAFFTHGTGHNQLASEAFDSSSLTDPSGTPLGITISPYSQYNPTGVEITSFKLRTVDTGDRQSQSDKNVYQGTIGVKATLLDRFEWDNSYTYGAIDQNITGTGYLNISQLAAQLGPSKDGVCYSDSSYTQIVPNCTPVNFLGTTGNTYASLSKPVNEHYFENVQVANSNISGDLFALPAGAISGAIGLEYRRYTLQDTPDALAQAFELSESNGVATEGSYNVREVYGEFLIPVVKNLPGAYSVNVSLGGRYSHYYNFGDTTNGKYQLEWKPIRDLLVRATYADVFRAPTISNLYAGNVSDAPSYSDPCEGYYDGSALASNPACATIPKGVYDSSNPYKQANSQGNAVSGGNPNVGPETGYTTDFGFVYDPDWYRPLTISADFWHFSIKDAIETLDLNTAIQACAATGDSTYCGNFTRDPSTSAPDAGQVVSGFEGPANIGQLDTRGFDFGVALNYPKTRFGSFQFSLNGTYLDKYEQTVASIAKYSVAGETSGSFIGGGYPRLKFTSSLDWTYLNWDVVLRNRFVSGIRDDGGQDGQGNTLGVDLSGLGEDCRGTYYNTTVGQTILCSRDAGYVDYQDVSVTYKVKKIGTDFTVGANDIFDQGAPIVYTYGPSFNYDASNYDVTGRYVYGRVRVYFK